MCCFLSHNYININNNKYFLSINDSLFSLFEATTTNKHMHLCVVKRPEFLRSIRTGALTVVDVLVLLQTMMSDNKVDIRYIYEL